MSELLTQISNIAGPNGLISGDDVHARPADWLGRSNCRARAIVRPASTQELSNIMRLCHAAGQSVIGDGGLTGLIHATDATPDDILISFERMTAIESIDPVGRTLSVQSGAQLQKVQEAAREQKLLFAVDLGARGSATIGGTMSTNAGGNQVVRRAVLRLHPLPASTG